MTTWSFFKLCIAAVHKSSWCIRQITLKAIHSSWYKNMLVGFKYPVNSWYTFGTIHTDSVCRSLQCFVFSRNIGQVTPKIIYFHDLKKSYLDQSIQYVFNLILKTGAQVVYTLGHPKEWLCWLRALTHLQDQRFPKKRYLISKCIHLWQGNVKR